MTTYGVTDIQNKPSLIKMMDIAEIIDRRKHTTDILFLQNMKNKLDLWLKKLIEKKN